jgi:hypothetical protein
VVIIQSDFLSLGSEGNHIIATRQIAAWSGNTASSKSDRERQQANQAPPVVGFFKLLGQAHDELKSEDRGYHCRGFL